MKAWQDFVQNPEQSPVKLGEELRDALATMSEGLKSIHDEMGRVTPTPEGPILHYTQDDLNLVTDIDQWFDTLVAASNYLDDSRANADEDKGLGEIAECVASAYTLLDRFADIMNAQVTLETQNRMQAYTQPLYDAVHEPLLAAAQILGEMGIEHPVLRQLAGPSSPPQKG